MLRYFRKNKGRAILNFVNNSRIGVSVMKLFRKNKTVLTIPNGYVADDIKVESSICTGEKIVGFYDKSSNRLVCDELVESESDIEGFYRKYGIEYHKDLH